MSRIFFSHSSKDKFEAIALRDWLASEGWNDVFLDLDPERGIAAGERWERALHAAANLCEAVIFLVSAKWLESGWCLKEYSLARGLNKKLFAALINARKTAVAPRSEVHRRSRRRFHVSHPTASGLAHPPLRPLPWPSARAQMRSMLDPSARSVLQQPWASSRGFCLSSSQQA
jgi:TIR domain